MSSIRQKFYELQFQEVIMSEVIQGISMHLVITTALFIVTAIAVIIGWRTPAI